MEGLNIRLLDSMLHEQFHALFHHLICGLNQGEGELYRELKEYKTYFDCHEVTERQQQADIRKEFYLYITNPDEYYAFEYAYENTLNIFRYINGRYGFDDSLVVIKITKYVQEEWQNNHFYMILALFQIMKKYTKYC